MALSNVKIGDAVHDAWVVDIHGSSMIDIGFGSPSRAKTDVDHPDWPVHPKINSGKRFSLISLSRANRRI